MAKDQMIGLLDEVSGLVENNSMLDDEKTNPGIVVGCATIENELYQRGVSEVLKLEEVEKLLKRTGFLFRGYKNRRGLIGAAASLAWKPETRTPGRSPGRTFELITYRLKERWGTTRMWDGKTAILLEEQIPSTFDSYDRVNDVPRIAPNTPCPVFYGVRGTDAIDLPKALELVKVDEPIDRWVIFETNHASDDHLRESRVIDFVPYQSVSVEGTVTKAAVTEKGGHTFMELADNDGMAFACAAYEPTKGFRDVVRAFVKGDRLKACGGLRSGDPDLKLPTINLEKLYVLETVELRRKIGNPGCPDCGKTMKSIGEMQGFRCRTCSRVATEDDAEYEVVTRDIEKGWYEVPICARRHLSCPLCLLGFDNDFI
jgi:tRNA(Ile2)-agmatinylcytidine synthase